MALILSAGSYFRLDKRIKMYTELYKYLILHKQLNIPGIGRFEIEKKPADIDFATRVVNAPKYNIAFRQVEVMPSRKFFNWLEAELGISEMDAVKKFNDFTYDLRNALGRSWYAEEVAERGDHV